MITPFVAIEAAGLRSGGFDETSITGSKLLGLNVASQSATDLSGFVGLRFQNTMPLAGLDLAAYPAGGLRARVHALSAGNGRAHQPGRLDLSC